MPGTPTVTFPLPELKETIQMTPIIPRPVLKSTTRSADLTQNIVNLPLPINTHRSRQQNALLVPQRFKIVESLGVNGTCSLDLGDNELADLASRLDLPGFDVSRKNCLFIGPKDQLKELLDFANLFTSVRGQLSSDVETELGQICANLVLSGDMKLSGDNTVSGCAALVDMLAFELAELAQKSPEAAFALFSRCSARTQVAILNNQESVQFAQAIGVSRLKNSCAKKLMDLAGLAVKRPDPQFLKLILTGCPSFALARVLKSMASKYSDMLALLCMNDPDLKHVLLGALPSNTNLPLDPVGVLRSQLTNLPQHWLPSPSDSKPHGVGDLQCYKSLKTGGWLTVAPSGTLHLDNVPTKRDILVKDVLELMMMESPHTAMRLALDLFGGFSGLVKRSAHIDWTTPRAIQALCAIQGHAVQLEAAGDPTAALAKKVIDKFRKRLAAAWAGLDSAARATSLSALLAELDGRELATARELLPPLDMQIIDFDSALRQWITERLVAAFNAGSGEGARVAMRRCGVLGVALASGNRKAENFIGEMLSSLINDQSNRTQDDDMLRAFLSMLEEADYQVFANLALANTTAGPGETAGSLIVQIHAGGQVDVVPGPLADRFRALMREWLSTKYSVPLSQDPYVLALNQIIPPASQPVLGATSFDYLQAMSRAMLPDASPQGAWLAQLREGAAKLVGADPGSPQAAAQNAKSLQQIASALASAPPGYSPSPEVRDVMASYLLGAVKGGDWMALSGHCQTFGSENGQIFLAELLGGFASTAWKENNFDQSARVLASYLNSGPISPKAMRQFTTSSQGILGALQLGILWSESYDPLFIPAGRQARSEWVKEALVLVQLKLASGQMIGRVKALGNLATKL